MYLDEEVISLTYLPNHHKVVNLRLVKKCPMICRRSWSRSKPKEATHVGKLPSSSYDPSIDELWKFLEVQGQR